MLLGLSHNSLRNEGCVGINKKHSNLHCRLISYRFHLLGQCQMSKKDLCKVRILFRCAGLWVQLWFEDTMLLLLLPKRGHLNPKMAEHVIQELFQDILFSLGWFHLVGYVLSAYWIAILLLGWLILFLWLNNICDEQSWEGQRRKEIFLTYVFSQEFLHRKFLKIT